MVFLLASLQGCGLVGCNTCPQLGALEIEGEVCPSSEIRLSLSVEAKGLVRGSHLTDPAAPEPLPGPPAGTLAVTTTLMWLSGDGTHVEHRQVGFLGEADVTAALIDRGGQSIDVALSAFEVREGRRQAEIALPEVPDGDYRLRVEVAVPGVDRAVAEVPLALYAPALVHVMSDRPLVRPGETVHLRSLVLRRSDLAPLPDRPGRWKITAPDGVEILTEPDTAGSWGVADTELPVHPDAPSGAYRAIYESGWDRDTVTFEVRPFVLPRLSAEIVPDRAWFQAGDDLAVRGVARYASGAPVADAEVTLTVSLGAASWPPPLAWEEPIVTRTAADGTFRASWGTVPRDLFGRVPATAEATVRESGGEAIHAATGLVLSRESLWIQALTELGDGLVGGVNNRAYLRVTTPDGAPLAGARVEVSNPWDPLSGTKRADADEDGVVAIQIDPGSPVTLVSPAPPVRRSQAVEDEEVPSLGEAIELAEEREPTLDEMRALDAAGALLQRCRDAEVGAVTRTVGVQVASSGAVLAVVPTSSDPASACMVDALRALRLPAGAERTFRLTFELPASQRPRIEWNERPIVGESEVTDAVEQAFEAAARTARSCLPPGEGVDGAEALAVHWRVRAGRAEIETRHSVRADHGLGAGTVACVTRALSGLRLAQPPDGDGLGVLVASLEVPTLPGEPVPEPAPSPTTSTGYELAVIASMGGRPAGEGRIRLPEGQIPPLRIRATPSLVRPGETVEVELIRGPDSTLELPEEIGLASGEVEIDRAEVSGNKASFVVPVEARGFLSISYAGVTAHLFVERPDRLAVSIAPDREVYRPGERARLTVRATAGDEPAVAAVGLVGLDASLGQLAALPGPDEYGRVTVRARNAGTLFDGIEARGLLLGRIRGRNAAQAAIQRIEPPSVLSERSPAVAGTASAAPDEAGVLTRSFGRAFAGALQRVRAWEAAAAEGETFDNAAMAEIWRETLAELRETEPVRDAWGRELTLERLPPELLVQLDPRQLLHDGTHLPEDMVAWSLYVSRSP